MIKFKVVGQDIKKFMFEYQENGEAKTGIKMIYAFDIVLVEGIWITNQYHITIIRKFDKDDNMEIFYSIKARKMVTGRDSIDWSSGKPIRIIKALTERRQVTEIIEDEDGNKVKTKVWKMVDIWEKNELMKEQEFFDFLLKLVGEDEFCYAIANVIPSIEELMPKKAKKKKLAA